MSITLSDIIVTESIGLSTSTKEKKRNNYAGSKTLPASIKEKETHWPEVP
jgi:hypothetical protein